MTTKIRLMLLGIGVILLCGCGATEETGSATADIAVPVTQAGPPDLNGMWQVQGTASWNLEGHTAIKGPATPVLGALGGIPAGMTVVEGGGIPYQDWALAQRDQNRANWEALDPGVKCYIPGIPRLTYMPFPLQIVQSEDKIFIAYEFGSNSRTIHMDRPGSEAPLPSWMGYSLGRWEEGSLVVDVSAQMAETWFDASGNFHGENLRVEERYTPMGPNHLRYEATITDPDVFTRPWKISMPLYRRLEENARILEYKCVPFAEDAVYGHLRKRNDEPAAN